MKALLNHQCFSCFSHRTWYILWQVCQPPVSGLFFQSTSSWANYISFWRKQMWHSVYTCRNQKEYCECFHQVPSMLINPTTGIFYKFQPPTVKHQGSQSISLNKRKSGLSCCIDVWLPQQLQLQSQYPLHVEQYKVDVLESTSLESNPRDDLVDWVFCCFMPLLLHGLDNLPTKHCTIPLITCHWYIHLPFLGGKKNIEFTIHTCKRMFYLSSSFASSSSPPSASGNIILKKLCEQIARPFNTLSFKIA